MIDLRHNNRAFALTFTLIFLFLIISFMTIFILAVASALSQSNRLANEKKAYYIADAGLADAYERITQTGLNVVFTSTCVNPNVPTTCSSPYIPSATTDNGVYSVGTTTAHYVVSVQYSNAPRTNYMITSTGTFNGISKTLQLTMISASISKYAYWSQTEVNPQYGQLWWVGTGDPNTPGSFVYLTSGPVQTNGTLNIFGNPIFYNNVTEANGDGPGNDTLNSPAQPSPYYYYGDQGTNPTNPNDLASEPSYDFPGGIQNDAPQVNLPPQQTLNTLKTEASDGSGLVLTGASTIIFNAPNGPSNPNSSICPTGTYNASGTVTITGVVKNAQGVVTATYNNCRTSAPANGVIYVQSNTGQQDGNATVQGTVSGQLTVTADQNIYVSGSVAYNNDPRIDPSSTDLVGLVANQNITVIEASAPNDLEMAAVMVALQGSFQVDQWWVYRGPASGPGAAAMDQFGSLINYVCGVTGEMDLSGDLLGGWNQVQSYDNRLATMAPPGFPPYVNNQGFAIYTKESITEL